MIAFGHATKDDGWFEGRPGEGEADAGDAADVQARSASLDPSLLKALVFGTILAVVACREGLASEGGAAGVGAATNRSVVIAILLIYAMDLILTWILRPIQL